MSDSTLIRRVIIQNYKSIEASDVALGPLTFLVGPNGSGKSNFLDALHLVADALQNSLEHAVSKRGGSDGIGRRQPLDVVSADVLNAEPVCIALEIALPTGASGVYSVRMQADGHGSFVVLDEQCVLREGVAKPREHSYTVQRGRVTSTMPNPPPAFADRLYLVAASGLPEFRPVYDALSRMRFYHLDPRRLAAVQRAASGHALDSDGANINSVIAQLERDEPGALQRIREYLAVLLPGFEGLTLRNLAPGLRLEFCQRVAPAFTRRGATGPPSDRTAPLCLPAESMSDGTLRALGILVSLFQPSNGTRPAVGLVGIEEPETALHPAALGVLLDALREASARRQILVTSHSSDLLDNKDVDPASVLAVYWEEGRTLLAPLSDVGRSILDDRLSTAGELLRSGQLVPGSSILEEPSVPEIHTAAVVPGER